MKYVKIYRSKDGKNYASVGVQIPFTNPYTDYTGETGTTYQYKISLLNHRYIETNLSAAVTAKTKAMSDDELLTMVQEASFRYYWEGAESESGLAKENIPGRHKMIASGASGSGIMALIVGAERNFISRKEAVTRFIKNCKFFRKGRNI